MNIFTHLSKATLLQTCLFSLFEILVLGGAIASETNLCLSSQQPTAEYYPQTRICSNDTIDCVVVYPEAYRDAAEQLAACFKKCAGGAPELISVDAAFPDPVGPLLNRLSQNHVVFIGNLENNRALAPLYAGLFCGVDASYPGRGGHVLRTISNPWGTGKNAIVIGGSDAEGVRIALRLFIEAVPSADAAGDVVLPRLMDIRLADDLRDIVFSPRLLDEVKGGIDSGLYPYPAARFIMSAFRYHWTGSREWGELALRYLRWFNERPEDYYPVSHYETEAFYRACDILEEAPFVEDSDRQRTSRKIAATFFHTLKTDWASPKTINQIGDRHMAGERYSEWVAARYLLRTYRQDKAWGEVIEARLMFLQKNYAALLRQSCYGSRQDNEGLDSSSSYLRWALETGYASYFAGDLPRTALAGAIGQFNSLGYYCGKGIYSTSGFGQLFMARGIGYPTALCAFVYRDSRMAWLLRGFNACRPDMEQHEWFLGDALPGPVGKFNLQLPAREPDFLLGLSVFPDHIMSERPEGRQDNSSSFSFELACFRSGFEPEADYLMIHGGDYLQPANAIIQFVSGGYIWLFTNCMRTERSIRNCVAIAQRMGARAGKPRSEAKSAARFDGAAIFSAVLTDEQENDWTRAVFNARRGEFLVLDVVRVGQEDDYFAQCLWRLPVSADWKDDSVLTAFQGNKRFRIMSAAPVEAEARRDDIPDGAALAFKLRQIQGGHYKPGDYFAFQNLLQVTGRERPDNAHPVRLGTRTVLIRRNDGTALLCGLGGVTNDLPWLEVSDGAYAIDTNAIYLADVRTMVIAGHTVVDQEQPVTVKINVSDGKCLPGHNLADLYKVARTWELPAASSPVKVTPALASVIADALAGCNATVPAGTQHLKADSAKINQNAMPLSVKLLGKASLPPEGKRLVSDMYIDDPAIAQRALRVIDGVLAGGDGAMTWPPAEPAALSVVWPVARKLSEIRIYLNRVPSGNRASLPARPYPGNVAVAWMADGQTVTTNTCRAQINCDLFQLPAYKGKGYAFEYIAVPGPASPVNGCRITINPESGSNAISVMEIMAFSDDDAPCVPFKIMQTRGEDGRPMLVLGTRGGTLLGLSERAEIIWQNKLPAYLINIALSDIDGDGLQELLTTSTDYYVRAFAMDGSLRWKRSTAELSKPFSGMYPDGSLPFVASAWTPAVGTNYVLMGGYHCATIMDKNGSVLTNVVSGGGWAELILNGIGPRKTDALIITDTLFWDKGYAAVIGLSPEGGPMPIANFYVPGGRPLAWKLTQDTLLYTATDGVMAVRFAANRAPECLWMKTGVAYAAAVIADLDNDGKEELVVAEESGFLRVINASTGNVTRTVNPGISIRALDAFKKGAMTFYFLAGDDGWGVYTTAWQPVATGPDPCSAILALNGDDGTFALVSRGVLRIMALEAGDSAITQSEP